MEFSIRKSIRYHTQRRRFFDNLSHASTAITALCGSSAFVALLSDNNAVGLNVTACIAVVSTLNLVIGFAKRSYTYNDLQGRCSTLLKQMTLEDKTEGNLRKWQAERVLIEKDEPTPLRILNILCHNEEAIAQGNDEDIYKIGWLQTALRHFISFDSYKPQLVKSSDS